MGKLRITLYTRQGCHLCDEALALLAGFALTFPLTVEKIDIDQDMNLAAAFGDKVPVIEIAGRPRLWGKINPVLLRRLLAAESRS